MPANGRRDLIRRLKVNEQDRSAGLTLQSDTNRTAWLLLSNASVSKYNTHKRILLTFTLVMGSRVGLNVVRGAGKLTESKIEIRLPNTSRTLSYPFRQY